ncbi:MAG: acyl-CoA thioesterase [Candidatus Omnitrophica bacterium]|nr:acyl-CoA thioesterase [Candidatus Omnitrophota bacterium]
MEKTIFYHDTDAGGVVYYANYLKYMEEARTVFFIQKGIALEDLKDGQFFYAVRKCSVTYQSPARYGDTIICETQLEKITAAQIFFKQNIYNKQDNRILVTADVTLVCLTADFKATTVSEEVKQKLSA